MGSYVNNAARALVGDALFDDEKYDINSKRLRSIAINAIGTSVAGEITRRYSLDPPENASGGLFGGITEGTRSFFGLEDPTSPLNLGNVGAATLGGLIGGFVGDGLDALGELIQPTVTINTANFSLASGEEVFVDDNGFIPSKGAFVNQLAGGPSSSLIDEMLAFAGEGVDVDNTVSTVAANEDNSISISMKGMTVRGNAGRAFLSTNVDDLNFSVTSGTSQIEILKSKLNENTKGNFTFFGVDKTTASNFNALLDQSVTNVKLSRQILENPEVAADALAQLQNDESFTSKIVEQGIKFINTQGLEFIDDESFNEFTDTDKLSVIRTGLLTTAQNIFDYSRSSNVQRVAQGFTAQNNLLSQTAKTILTLDGDNFGDLGQTGIAADLSQVFIIPGFITGAAQELALRADDATSLLLNSFGVISNNTLDSRLSESAKSQSQTAFGLFASAAEVVNSKVGTFLSVIDVFSSVTGTSIVSSSEASSFSKIIKGAGNAIPGVGKGDSLRDILSRGSDGLVPNTLGFKAAQKSGLDISDNIKISGSGDVKTVELELRGQR
ncbi:hypothetical protein MNBD_GAMMA09-637, partial [hydrothermal vent metagenome]